MAKIDNDKMWASLIKSLNEMPIYYWLKNRIDDALKDQGLQYNPETKEIESIEPEQCPCDECSLYCNGAEPTCPDYQEYLKDTEPEPEFTHSEVTKGSDKELTEFEKTVWGYLVGMHDYPIDLNNSSSEDILSNICNELLSVARKQIASEIDVEELVDVYQKTGKWENIPEYRKGVEDTINVIKK